MCTICLAILKIVIRGNSTEIRKTQRYLCVCFPEFICIKLRQNNVYNRQAIFTLTR